VSNNINKCPGRDYIPYLDIRKFTNSHLPPALALHPWTQSP